MEYLGEWNTGYEGQIWHFVLCEVSGLQDFWINHTMDDGGLDFSFYWQDLESPICSDCHSVFEHALLKITQLLADNSAL
ncbi:hypothetical protein M0C34_01000 [Agarivorans sp. TSD2052]|nr:hypothetical protein M0C34_01000 [Agarivorans sp. TSD2052]